MIKSHGLRDEIDFSALQISVRAKHCLVRNGIGPAYKQNGLVEAVRYPLRSKMQGQRQLRK